jgi:hypothetical protein
MNKKADREMRRLILAATAGHSPSAITRETLDAVVDWAEAVRTDAETLRKVLAGDVLIRPAADGKAPFVFALTTESLPEGEQRAYAEALAISDRIDQS